MMLKGHKQPIAASATHTGVEWPRLAFTSFGLGASACASTGLDLKLINGNGMNDLSAQQRFANYRRNVS